MFLTHVPFLFSGNFENHCSNRPSKYSSVCVSAPTILPRLYPPVKMRLIANTMRVSINARRTTEFSHASATVLLNQFKILFAVFFLSEWISPYPPGCKKPLPHILAVLIAYLRERTFATFLHCVCYCVCYLFSIFHGFLLMRRRHPPILDFVVL